MTKSYPNREKFFVYVITFSCALLLAHFVHIGWLNYVAEIKAGVPQGVPEPNLRIGMPFVFSLLERAFHPHDTTLIVTGSDFLCILGALNILYIVLVNTMPASEDQSIRSLTVALFLVFIQFPIANVVPLQRPETLPCTLYLAFSLLCLTRSRQHPLWSVALIVAATAQAFVRSDIGIVFGAALLLASLAGSRLEVFGSRSLNVARAVMILGIDISYQIYMQFVRYRDVPYKKGSPISANFTLHSLVIFIAAALPFFFVAWFFSRNSTRLTAVEMIILIAAGLYLPFYVCLGVISEVRIYVPFFFCLSLVAARQAAMYLLVESPA